MLYAALAAVLWAGVAFASDPSVTGEASSLVIPGSVAISLLTAVTALIRSGRNGGEPKDKDGMTLRDRMVRMEAAVDSNTKEISRGQGALEQSFKTLHADLQSIARDSGAAQIALAGRLATMDAEIKRLHERDGDQEGRLRSIEQRHEWSKVPMQRS